MDGTNGTKVAPILFHGRLVRLSRLAGCPCCRFALYFVEGAGWRLY